MAKKNVLLQQGEGGRAEAGVVIAVVTEAERSTADTTLDRNHVVGLLPATAATAVQPGFAG